MRALSLLVSHRRELYRRSNNVTALILIGIITTGVSLLSQTYGWAQAPLTSVNTRSFRPTMDALSLITVERSVALPHLKLNLGLMIDSERDSLSYTVSKQRIPIIQQVTTGQLNIALGLWSRLNLTLSLPLHILQTDLDGPRGSPTASSDGVGDLSISLKGIILNSAEYPLGIALLLHTYWGPLGEPLPLLSDQATPLFEPWLIIDSSWKWASLSGNIGYRARETSLLLPSLVNQSGELETPSDPIQIGAELVYRAGLSIHYLPDFIHHCFEVSGASPLGVEGAQRAQRLEVLSGLKLIFDRGSFLTFGGGRGLIDGYHQAAWRIFMGITFHPKSRDSDQDGLIDAVDQCPREPEDVDQFEDQDGCPDPDNDQDGFLDLYDLCPNKPEDLNQFEDEDGCPDQLNDQDQDGLPDHQDECPQEAEDLDEYNDADGCPDPDNDQDSVPDQQDQCPNNSEDFDHFKDEDGCPDLDNDQDQVPDERDSCPMTPEDRDGDADEDGCPEESSQLVTDQGERLEIKGKVFFDLNQARIKPKSYELLRELAKFLNQRLKIKRVEVQGHTDQRGRRDYNLELSERRAAAVRLFLIEECGVSADRLVSRGYGPDQPLSREESAEAYARNRRVELIVLDRED